MSMGFTTHKHLGLSAGVEDPTQLIIRPEWDAPHVRCLPRTFCAWPCLLRQVGTVLGSPCDCIVTGITYANPGSRQDADGFRSTYLGVLPIAFEPLPFFCSIVSFAVRLLSCQLPSCDLLFPLALLSSFGRETSLVNITGPRSIFPPLFTSSIYFQLHYY